MKKKASEILQELNGITGTDWQIGDALNAYMKVEMNPATGKYTFFPNSGTIVTVFVNTKTGELKSYFEGLIERDV